jgi:hypothetical protein
MRRRSIVRAATLVILLVAPMLGQANNAVPLLYQPLIPASVAPGSGAFTLTVNGSGFASTAVVNWNGLPRLTEMISSSQLKASISASDVSKAKTAWITVTNPPPGGGSSNVVFLPVTKVSAAIGMAISQPFSGSTDGVVGDFNHDGKLDVAWSTTTGLNVSLGDGKGGFAAPITNTMAANCSGMFTGDFNNDGKLDIAAYCKIVVVLLGNGDGTFTESWSYDSPEANNSIATADFNGDGNLDLYITGWDLGQQWFAIWTGKGDGTFNLPTTYYYTSYFGGSPAIGDFNGDGLLDLAVPEGLNSRYIDIWLGQPNGGFQELGSLAASSYPNVTAADVNLDGKLDLITNNGCVYLGVGNGTFTGAGCISNAALISGVGDFNGDGKPDLAIAEVLGSPQQMGIYLGAGNGTFPNSFQFAFANGGGAFWSQAVGDFNNDGKLDVVAPNGYLLLQTTVDLTPISLGFGNQNIGTTSAPQTATLTNVGSSPLPIHTIGITGTDAGDFAQTNGCGSSLAAGASCTISVTFKPKTAGSLVANLTVNYTGTGSPQRVALSGTGIAPPTVSLTPPSLTFTTQLIGTTSGMQTATLTNTGDLPVTISAITTPGAFSQTNNCGRTLGVNGNCQIQVVFKPTAPGVVTGPLSVTDNAIKSPQRVALSGTGTVVTLSPAGVNFGDQKVGTASAAAAITMTNIWSHPISITQISIAGTDPGDFTQTNNCESGVKANASCTIQVKFKPTAKGARSAAVSITDNGGASPQSVPLAGTGT